uniref:Uncharacterized protein n=1 Tax=Abalone asfa-like virus TaxID=2839893 RepID=A0A5K7XYG6_9VIRU|nr:hypothetical protein [Abalone asfa-like virus]BCY04532.1 Histone-like DNA-binding protein [Abalone asfa-like virus]
MHSNILLIILIVIAILLFICFIRQNFEKIIIGGAFVKRPDSIGRSFIKAKTNLVIDSLNLTHWLYPEKEHICQEDVISMIKTLTPKLRKHYSNKLMFVTKDAENTELTYEQKKQFNTLAHDLKVYIYLAEKLRDVNDKKDPTQHSYKGRDDFMMTHLGNSLDCAVLTKDSLKDIQELELAVPPFKLSIFSFMSKYPEKMIITPKKLTSKRKKPVLIWPDSLNLLVN